MAVRHTASRTLHNLWLPHRFEGRVRCLRLAERSFHDQRRAGYAKRFRNRAERVARTASSLINWSHIGRTASIHPFRRLRLAGCMRPALSRLLSVGGGSCYPCCDVKCTAISAPNLTLGPPSVSCCPPGNASAARLPPDDRESRRVYPAFADAGADWVSVHYEACRHLHRRWN